jgi:hypothetical protein
VNLQPRILSTVFVANQVVTVTGSANVRLGPGTNYYAFSSASAGAQGTVVAHALNGVYAKGLYWWNVNFSGTVGWIAESLLAVPNTAPSILQQPASQSSAAGGSATFSVVAGGSTPFSYQWQKNSANLTNGGHYSGAATASLTITNASASDAASYRCVVTNAYGGTNSSAATLTLTVGCTPGVLVNADFEGGNSGGVATSWVGYQRGSPAPTTVWSIQTASPPSGGGSQYQQIANTSSATSGGGVRQNVTGCVIGATYQVSGWMRGNSGSATNRVKVSPSASTNWATAVDLNPPQTCNTNIWVAFSGTVVAAGTNMTVWLDGQTGGTGLNKAECFDSVAVLCLGAPVAPHFESVTWMPQSQPRLVLSGSAGSSITIQRSSNLVNWVVLTNLINPSGTLQYTDTTAAGVLQRFYRATSP